MEVTSCTVAEYVLFLFIDAQVCSHLAWSKEGEWGRWPCSTYVGWKIHIFLSVEDNRRSEKEDVRMWVGLNRIRPGSSHVPKMDSINGS